MAKYEKLGHFLDEHVSDEIPMTFAEIEHVVGQKLPSSSRYPAWWSNNPSNNVMTKIWLNAGYKTRNVNIEAKTVVFYRVSHPHPQPVHKGSTHEIPGMAEMTRGFSALPPGAHEARTSKIKGAPPKEGYYPFYGSMKGLITIAPGVDLTEPAADPKSWKRR